MKQRAQRVEDWLKDFLEARCLQSPDARHLFAYRISPDEFFDLERILRAKINAASCVGKTVFAYWGDFPAFGALFVLYASRWWQQYYDGSSFEWKPIMEALAFPPDSWNSAEMPAPLKAGLAVWKLEPASEGFKYLGAIAREAGLPQRLLVEHKGCVGKILETILREALARGESGRIVQTWVESMKDYLPASYRHEVVISLLADFIVAVINIKQQLRSTSAEQAFNELETTFPLWRERFPLPIDNADARELLHQLLRDATSSSQANAATGYPIRIERRLRQLNPDTWELNAAIIVPEMLSIPVEANFADKPKLLSLQILFENGSIDTPLRKHAVENYYFHTLSKSKSVPNKVAASEVQLSFATSSGLRHTVPCPGGQELDDDLPWVFEYHEQGNLFRQQGGGSVRSASMLVALASGWAIDPAATACLEEAGELLGFDRKIFRLTGHGEVHSNGVRFKLQTARIANVAEYSWKGKRYWDAAFPHMAFWGMPFPLQQSSGNTTELHAAQLYWKWPHSKEFMPVREQLCGLVDLWFRAPSGESLRNRMLILPESAQLRLNPVNANTGVVVLDNWRAERVCLAEDSYGLECAPRVNDISYEISLTSRKGTRPPEQVELSVYWENCPLPARICAPFPARGARLFDGQGHEIMPNQLLCVSDLIGMRLCGMPDTARHVQFGLAFVAGKHRLEYSINTPEQGHFYLRVQDWRKEILEMLATVPKLDAQVSMCVTEDYQDVTCWRFSRYNNRLLRKAEAQALELETMSNRPVDQLTPIKLHAICLTSPHSPLCHLEEQTSEDVPVGRWFLKDKFPCNGAWLIFEPVEHSTIRPVLWKVEDTGINPPANRLEAAIGAPTEERQQRISACLETMCDEPTAPEWETVSCLTTTLAYLPLSSLDLWETVSHSGKAMAIMALRPDVDFSLLTARASEELPFLWETVNRLHWELAAQHLQTWCLTTAGEEGWQRLYKFLIKERRTKISAQCPVINGLLHIALPLDEDARNLKAVKQHFTLENALPNLYGTTLVALNRCKAEASWPQSFEAAVGRARENIAVSRFLPPFQGYRESVLTLPILLALQVYSGQPLVFENEALSAKTVFEFRQHINFAPEWFDDAFTCITYSCFAENFQPQVKTYES